MLSIFSPSQIPIEKSAGLFIYILIYFNQSNIIKTKCGDTKLPYKFIAIFKKYTYHSIGVFFIVFSIKPKANSLFFLVGQE